MSTLSPNEKRSRWLALALLPVSLVLLRALPADGVPTWIPFSTSCGAVTGLPCIFCGLTRALHFLLQGEFSRALYFNWLAFPAVAVLAIAFVVVLAEVCTGRNHLAKLPRPHLTQGLITRLLAGLFLLWTLQVCLAVSQHKRELLNPTGPLYSFVVRR